MPISYGDLWAEFCEAWSNNEENNNSSDLWEVASEFVDRAYELGRQREKNGLY